MALDAGASKAQPSQTMVDQFCLHRQKELVVEVPLDGYTNHRPGVRFSPELARVR